MKNPIQLSVVATSRNDNHGVTLLYRMQYFIDSFIEQCKRHNLRAELILVEWNPPEDRPPLVEALSWPKDSSSCDIRILKFPTKLHAKLKNSTKLPLFQMIAKNVGIRRARGRFVLATNIDIIFSDEIICFMRDKLKSGCLYRANRWDIPNHLPKVTSFSKLLTFCKKEAFRVHLNGYSLTKQDPKWNSNQVLKLNLSPKWDFVLRKIFILMQQGVTRAKTIFKFMKSLPLFTLIRIEKIINILARSFAQLQMQTNYLKQKLLRIAKTINFIPQSPAQLKIQISSLKKHFLSWWAIRFNYKNYTLIKQGIKKSVSGLWYQFILNIKAINHTRIIWKKKVSAAMIRLISINLAIQTSWKEFSKPFLHTNACGDFTLLAKEDWEKLRGYPEWPIFSWHLDSVLLYQAYYMGIKEVNVGVSKRIFHIEHSVGSGFTEEGANQLFNNLIQKKIPYLTYEQFQLITNNMKKKCDANQEIVYNSKSWGFADENLKIEVINNLEPHDLHHHKQKLAVSEERS